MTPDRAKPKRLAAGFAGAAIGGGVIGAAWPLFGSSIVGCVVAAVFLAAWIVVTLPWIRGLPPVWRWR